MCPKPINLYRLFGLFTPQQENAIAKINELLLEMILHSLDANGHMGVTKSKSAFEMFELSDTICESLSLPMKTWLMVYFDGSRPVISWEKNVIRTMHDKTAAELQASAVKLQRHRRRSDLVRLL